MKEISVIIPARNEEAVIGKSLDALINATRSYTGTNDFQHLDETSIEIIVVDNLSQDRTGSIVKNYTRRYGVTLASCAKLKAPCARNYGVRFAKGSIFLFVDADTVVPCTVFERVKYLVKENFKAGIFPFRPLEPGRRAWLWWAFWNQIRRLPLAHAKAMPALMFTTRRHFEEYGPFDEDIVLGEEWPLLADLYKNERFRFIYDWSIYAASSSRRMDLQRFGYLRTGFKYTWAVLHQSGRKYYSDKFRTKQTTSGAKKVDTLLATLAGSTRLNRIIMYSGGGQSWVFKKRRFVAIPTIFLGNIWLQYRKVPLTMLSGNSWLQNERKVHARLYGTNVESVRGWLKFRRFPGQTLETHLRNGTGGKKVTLKLIGSASRELLRIHQSGIVHGDALARNVCIDPEELKAYFFDFEFMATPESSLIWQYGNDLRAFIFSILSALPNQQWSYACCQIRDAYDSYKIWSQMIHDLRNTPPSQNIFHRAQIIMDYAWHERAVLFVLEHGDVHQSSSVFLTK